MDDTTTTTTTTTTTITTTQVHYVLCFALPHFLPSSSRVQCPLADYMHHASPHISPFLLALPVNIFWGIYQ
jgi:hypothetical protein